MLQIENKREDHGWETVQVHVREKRKWRKYPCTVRGNSFVQFKDNKVCGWWYHSCLQVYGCCDERDQRLQHTRTHTHAHTHTHTHTHTHQCTSEVTRLAATELDVFAGMERSVRIDHKNPMPTRWVLIRVS